MPTSRLLSVLSGHLDTLEAEGRLKGEEHVVTGELAAQDPHGPRFTLAGAGDRPFLRMNSNGYLGLASHPALRLAEEQGSEAFGTGPGAVRFISGTWQPHVQLEQRLAAFHGREDCILYSSAYAAMLGMLPPLTSGETAVFSDELNHNCIINAIALARPKEKHIYRHLALEELDDQLGAAAATCKRAIVMTDGVFSMRGDHAPLDRLMRIAARHDQAYAEGVIVIADDSHGVGAFGETGRGTEEVCGGRHVDVLVGTLGKAFGVNGGYVAGPAPLVRYLRETSPTYIYSNPITPAEAAAALAAVELVDSAEGREMLAHLRAVTQRFREGLRARGLETVDGEHPVVPLMVRDSQRTSALVRHLFQKGILATAIGYPVVPKGDEEIRFQISASHTAADIDEVLEALAAFNG